MRRRTLLSAGGTWSGWAVADVPALVRAAEAGDIATLRRLLDGGVTVDTRDAQGRTALLAATHAGRVDTARLLIGRGADLTSTNRYGGTALIPAAHHGHVETVRELLKTRIDVDHVSRLGWTGLLEAIILGDGGPARAEIVRLLVAHGASVHKADAQGVTPLANARQRGQRTIVDILQRAGARP